MHARPQLSLGGGAEMGDRWVPLSSTRVTTRQLGDTRQNRMQQWRIYRVSRAQSFDVGALVIVKIPP